MIRNAIRAAAVLLATLTIPAGILAASPPASAFGVASNAMAAGPRSASGPGSTNASGPGFTITGTVPGTERACTSNWNWKVEWAGVGSGWSEVEWTSNSCGFQIQDRSWCLAGTSAHVDSGIVTRTYLWDRASCNVLFPGLASAQQRYRSPGGSWSAWKTYWS
jgi:hypothetical protein